VPKIRKATKLKNDAQMTACLGDRTLVDTMVETELAASCIPLVKSKTNAIAMMTIINADTIESPVRHYFPFAFTNLLQKKSVRYGTL
jgi:hypothetical protein